MKNVRQSISKGLLLIFFTMILASCMTTKTNVGKYRENKGAVYTYAKGKQFWLFWGLLPMGRTNVNTPGDGNCRIVTRFNLLDGLISWATCGLVTSYTIKVKAKREQTPIEGNGNLNIQNNLNVQNNQNIQNNQNNLNNSNK